MTAVRPTGRGVAFLLAALLALLVAGRYDVRALLPVTGFLLALVALGAVTVMLAPRRLDLRRSVTPQVIDHGAIGTVTLQVGLRSSVDGGDIGWRALLPPELGGPAAGAVDRPGLGRSRTRTVEVDLKVTGVARGRHDLGPLVVEARDPFGLVVRRRRLADPLEVVVLPRRVVLPRLASLLGHEAGQDGRPTARRRGDGEDDVVSRTYQPGDPPKRIDWRTTARRGELMVRQDEPATAERIAVAVDPGTDAAAAEWALVAGASAITHLVGDGHATVTLVPGCPVRSITGAHDTARDALVDLAGLTHRDGAPVDLAGVDARPVVAVLGVVDPARARAWSAALRPSSAVRALVAAESGAAALAVLRSAGWRVVVWDDLDEVAVRWADLGREASRAPA
ncbi:DUF58 domain-containing protein [Aeromicrobium sp.]|uniref:DUF58 domain-containing protein n=1 Tax=Aeromicrobium sp. TaxID=1871063 RepID=UPI0025C3A78B|nr:DUF58 domain-containing protein [Aeromicrobium sp.]MCK5892464.1 DUF58 domain-containing protein [Aeromicrobium sp.]